MAINFPGSSTGLNAQATQVKHSGKPEPVKDKASESVHSPFSGPALDVFERLVNKPAPAAPPEKKTAESEKKDLKTVLEGLRAEAEQNPELEVFPPEQAPSLKRNAKSFDLKAAWNNSVDDPQPADTSAGSIGARRHRSAVSSGEGSGSGVLRSPFGSSDNLREIKGFGQAVEAGQGNHRRSRMSADDRLATLEQARLLARQKEETQMLSHKELVKLFDVPYQYALLNKQEVVADVAPSIAAEVLKDVHQVVIGDMHASFLKLMETLVVSDRVEMSRKSAEKIIKYAQKLEDQSLEGDDVAKAFRKLDKAISTIRWKDGDQQLFLLGDMLSDRGPLDNAMLSLVKHLKKQAPPGKIVWLASNHDHNALTYLTVGEHDVIPEQAMSMFRAIEAARINDKLTELGEDYYDYLANSKLMHLDRPTKTLLSHAPISEAELKKLHTVLPEGTPAVDDIQDLDGVDRFVDAANRFYHDYVLQNRPMLAARKHSQAAGSETAGGAWEQALAARRKQVEPVLTSEKGFLWTRNALKEKHELPFLKAGVETLLHGHDDHSGHHSPFSLFRIPEKAEGYTVVTLDQDIRKGAFKPRKTDLNTLYVIA